MNAYGSGAWEAFGRYDYMDIGSSVHDFGLASRDGNANRVWMTDVGLNWYMTQCLKMVFDWNHAEFNNPVIYNVDNVDTKKTATISKVLWWRLQLYF